MPAHNNLPIFIVLAMGIVLEVIALGCGIVARRTAPGKAGIIISILCLILGVVCTLFFTVAWTPTAQHSSSRTVTDSIGPAISPTRSMFPHLLPSSGPSTSPSTEPVAFNVPATPGVAATLDELSHVLAELPAPFKIHLEGNTQQQIADLDTQIWVMNFEHGPASFWLETSETGQQTFPGRLPADNPAFNWNIDHPNAHILMWLQPRWSGKMKQQLRQELRDSREAPDYAFGIDVDGKSVCRAANYPGFSERKIPLWFNEWPGTSVQTENGAFRFATIADGVRAMLLIKAQPVDSKDSRRVEFGLWYRPITPPVTNQSSGTGATR